MENICYLVWVYERNSLDIITGRELVAVCKDYPLGVQMCIDRIRQNDYDDLIELEDIKVEKWKIFDNEDDVDINILNFLIEEVEL